MNFKLVYVAAWVTPAPSIVKKPVGHIQLHNTSTGIKSSYDNLIFTEIYDHIYSKSNNSYVLHRLRLFQNNFCQPLT